ncbi:hypothetical protein [Actinopolymorpha alba]|uniref:hypothetical protein n=1 Tax=Actinopolymorpha alba TaxID=533267 RepID=UPI0003685A58|nr:hypothetical protein [Actinopolymorpha alba]
MLFAALGLAAMLPLLIRLRRRFTTWWAPSIALAIFAVMFSMSTFVIGPAVRAVITEPHGGGPVQPTPTISGHTRSHHP